MRALLTVERRHGALAARDCLAGAHLGAEFFRAGFADSGVSEADVVVEPGGCLNFAAHEEGVLVGYQELAIVGDVGTEPRP